MNPEDIIGGMDFSGLDDLGEGEYIQVPEGVKVAPYKVTAEDAKALAERAVVKYKDRKVVSDRQCVFHENSTRYDSLLELISGALHFALPSKIGLWYRLPDYEIRRMIEYGRGSTFKEVDFEIGEPILDYHPYSVVFSSTDVKTEDLYTGKRESNKKAAYPELDGYSSVQPVIPLEGPPAPLSIGILKGHKLSERGIKKTKRIVVREILSKPEGEIWYFPLWEVPVIAHREALTNWDINFYVRKKGLLFEHFTEHKHEWGFHTPFVSRGAIFFDGYLGKEDLRVLTDSFFNLENPQNNKPKGYGVLHSDKKLSLEHEISPKWKGKPFLQKHSLTMEEAMNIPERVEF